MKDFDVIVVGAGPTGIVAANLLGRLGLRTLAVDREADVYDLPRAAALHDDVQRLLDRAGLLEPILPATQEHVGAEFVDREGRRLTGVEFPGVRGPEGFPPLLAIAQPDIERLWRGCLAGEDEVELRVSQEVRGLRVGEEDVCVELLDRTEDRSYEVRSRWLIAADGASSFVRRSCGIAWESLGYDHEWLVVDVERDPSVGLTPLCTQICDPARPVTMIPMPGRRYRWEFQLLPGETREEMEDPRRVWELLAPWLGSDRGQIERAVVYRFHATIAATFRHGPIFLAGDAAHQTPPFAGQGLCTGLRDIDNLAWKLAAVRSGRASPELLDTYDQERRPAAVAMVHHSTMTGKLIDAWAESTRTGIPPPAELLAYGYGGGARLPDMSTGLVRHGRSEWVGRRMPQLPVADSQRSGRLDDLAGPNWALLSDEDPRERLDGPLRAAWERMGAVFLRVEDRNAALLFEGGKIAVLRPDRIVYALEREPALPAFHPMDGPGGLSASPDPA
jgi:3-(3-hydroxy-phenyl)propionate hydroxylase